MYNVCEAQERSAEGCLTETERCDEPYRTWATGAYGKSQTRRQSAPAPKLYARPPTLDVSSIPKHTDARSGPAASFIPATIRYRQAGETHARSGRDASSIPARINYRQAGETHAHSGRDASFIPATINYRQADDRQLTSGSHVQSPTWSQPKAQRAPTATRKADESHARTSQQSDTSCTWNNLHCSRFPSATEIVKCIETAMRTQ